MLKSRIELQNGTPRLLLENTPTPALAYTTYFEERSAYKDFLDCGYRIFFVNVSLTELPINSKETGFTPFRVGVFANPEHPDYSEFEEAVENILSACPEAVIFPRIYVSMPRWWVEAHPEDTVDTPKGGRREILFSPAFRRDGADLLRRLISHIKAAPYASRIGGWMFCGGNTQEWFHHDFFGSLCKESAPFFGQWEKERYGKAESALPTREDYSFSKLASPVKENARRYALFCAEGAARTVEHFAKVIKEECDYSQIVGTFYGYVLSVCSSLSGTHGLMHIADSDYLDYFSSPNCYTHNRPFGIDWSDMIPVSTLNRKGKLCFIECDIRTYLTQGVQESRPGVYPTDIYPLAVPGKPSVWSGPPTPELSQFALRKSFSHQLCKGLAIWWFDMWGGWYQDELLLKTLCDFRRIYQEDLSSSRAQQSEVIFFTDETSFANLCPDDPAARATTFTRIAMGSSGVAYDIFAVEDADTVLAHCRAAVFHAPLPSEEGKKALALCQSRGIPCLCPDLTHPSLTAEEIRSFLKSSGASFLCETEDIVYYGHGYAALHSLTGGKKTLNLPKAFSVKALFGAEDWEQKEKTISFTLKEKDTALFSLF